MHRQNFQQINQNEMNRQFARFRQQHQSKDPYAEIEQLVQSGKISRQMANWAIAMAGGQQKR